MEKFPEPKTLNPEPIDGSLLAPSLSKEMVTSARIQGMIEIADSILAADGVKSSINGIPALVSKFSYPITILNPTSGEGELYFARAARPLNGETPNKNQKSLPKLVFDETSDLPVITPNPNAVLFTESIYGFGLQVDISDLNPEVNNPEHAKLIMGTLTKIARGAQTEIEAKKAKELEEQTRRAQEQQAERRHAKQERKTRNARRMRRVKKIGGTVLGWAAGVGLAGGVVAGAIYGISKIELPHKQDYDEKGYTLTGGTELTLGAGSEGHPEFSKQLYEDNKLATNMMPTLFTQEEDGFAGSSQDMKLDATDTLRNIVIFSSKPGKNCATAEIDKAPLDTRLVAWTDFTGPDGNSRADELSVRYILNQVQVCWNGEERSELDDPRVVVTLRPAAESHPR